MPVLPVVLWTDALLFVLVVLVGLVVWQVRRHEHLRAPWRKVAMSRTGMAAGTLLAVFALIGLMDSLHFRTKLDAPDSTAQTSTQYAVELHSVLDVLLGGLPTRVETTYSAPLAAQSFAKEAQEGGLREFPRLQYGAAHLNDPERELAGDVAYRALAGGASGGALFLLTLLAISLLRDVRRPVAGMRRLLVGNGTDAWHWVPLTLLVLAVLAGALAGLASHYHVFGTDKVGQDVLYQVLKSIRTALVIGTLTTLVTLPIGVALGIAAGYFRGWVDDVIQYLYTTLNSIPGVLLIAAAVLMTQVYMDTHPESFETVSERADFRLLFLCLILGITSWTGLARLLRGETLKLRELEYVQAAQAFGVSNLAILGRHILPNLMHIILISMVMDFSGLVLAEAVLSYVGVGVDPSMFSFGTMINSARLEMAREPMVWWALAAAFVVMFALVLAANLFADAVRDALDPRTRIRRVS